MPPLGLAGSWAMLGEKVSVYDLIGLVPIALGIWLTTRPAKPLTLGNTA
jgi:drug/metabolite transporter (DMT)-like permease